MKELEFIAWLQDRLAEREPRFPLELRDDAGLVPLSDAPDCIVTTDMLMEGVHFAQGENLQRVGRKALAVNLSDLAAMAAEPVASLVSIAVPREGGFAVAQQIYQGLLPLADEYGCPIAGGDTNSWHGGLVISVTVMGRPTQRGPLLRSGAKLGDAILVTGSLGASLQSGKHLDFVPRVREAIALHADFELHAGMDISDGLLLDLQRLTTASHCGAVLDIGAVPVSNDAMRVSHSDRSKTAIDRALSDGEDFELLLTAAASEAERMVRDAQAIVPITIVGQIHGESGIWQRGTTGQLEQIKITGYQHPL